MFDLRTYTCVRKFNPIKEKFGISALAISNNFDTISSANFFGDVQFWDLSSGKLISNIQRNLKLKTKAVLSSPSNNTVSTGTLLGQRCPILALTYSDDDKTLFSGGFDSQISVYNINDLYNKYFKNHISVHFRKRIIQLLLFVIFMLIIHL